MEFHRMNKGHDEAQQISEVVLIAAEVKNREKWLKRRGMRNVKGKDSVIRGAT
jgi:hypothetical protein